MTNIKMSTANDLYECKYMTLDVIYVFQLLISLQFTGMSFMSVTPLPSVLVISVF